MKQVKVRCPAKINLTLEVLGKRRDGFHEIQSIMQTISLYDYLTIELNNEFDGIKIEGDSEQIPYNEKNIVYKAWQLYKETTNFCGGVSVYIEKNIPVCAGLAGGSTNAAGFLVGINYLCGNILNRKELHELCAKLGSDLNFCLEGGCSICTGRGENIEKLPSQQQKLVLIYPKNIAISAKEAYQKFSELPAFLKRNDNNTLKLKNKILNNEFDETLIFNSLENAVISNYTALQIIKTQYPKAIMSGSGPVFFLLQKIEKLNLDESEFKIFQGLNFTNSGVTII